jgi:hypothetical protein
MDTSTRAAIAQWVGEKEDADWGTISGRMENRIRTGVARLVGASASEEAEVSWAEIGAKIEQDVRGWVSKLVGAEENADWKSIGDRLAEQVRAAVDKVSENLQKDKETAAEEQHPAQPVERIVIESGEEPSDDAPHIESEESVD